MTSPLLSQKHSGLLKVVIHPLGSGESFISMKNFKDTTLFEYLGYACACIFTNLTTQLSVSIRLEDWEVIRFSTEEGVLEVLQVGGEALTIETDDPERLSFLFEAAAWAKEEESPLAEIPGIA